MKNERNPPIKCLVRMLRSGGALITIPADSMTEIRKRLYNLNDDEIVQTLVQNLTDGFCGEEYEQPPALYNLGQWDVVNGRFRNTGDHSEENLREVGERRYE